MGIHDRDYYRESARGMFDSWGRWGVTTWLIAISCGIYIAQLATVGAGSPLVEFAAYNYEKVAVGEVWRLATPIFLGTGIWSFACNMLTLYWAGSRLEDRYGHREFLLFFLAAGIFSYSAEFLAQLAGVIPPGVALGPWPALLAILVVYACHYPHEHVLLFVVSIPVWLLAVCYVGFAVLGAGGPGNRVPFSAYVAGALFGLFYYRFELHLSGLVPSLPSRTRALPRLRVVRSEPDESRNEPVPASVEAGPPQSIGADEPFETRVDRILEKVSRFGQESLSPEERELLFRASELYKKRRK